MRKSLMVRGLKTIAAISVMLACSSAKSATVEVSNNYFVGSSKESTVVPQAPDIVGPTLTNIVNSVYNDISGTLDGRYRSPWQWTKSLNGVEYEPFGKFTSVQAKASGEIAFGSNATTLQLVWGSPDISNRLEFIDDGVTVAAVTGKDITGSNVGVNFVKLILVGAEFDTVRFSSGANAFEIAKVSAQLNENLVTSGQFTVAHSSEY
jgi:hypothetical protein